MTHDPIQRWGLEWNTSAGRDFVVPDYQGRYVTYDDHVEAIRQAEQRVLDAARERVLGALESERIKWQYRVDTSDGEESMIGCRYIDYAEATERAIYLAAAALGEK